MASFWGAVNAVSYYVDYVQAGAAGERLNSAWFGVGAALKRGHQHPSSRALATIFLSIFRLHPNENVFFCCGILRLPLRRSLPVGLRKRTHIPLFVGEKQIFVFPIRQAPPARAENREDTSFVIGLTVLAAKVRFTGREVNNKRLRLQEFALRSGWRFYNAPALRETRSKPLALASFCSCSSLARDAADLPDLRSSFSSCKRHSN